MTCASKFATSKFLESNHFWLYDLNHVLFLESNMFNLLFKLFDSTIFVWSERICMPCWNQWSLCYEHPLLESWTLPAKIAPSTQKETASIMPQVTCGSQQTCFISLFSKKQRSMISVICHGGGILITKDRCSISGPATLDGSEIPPSPDKYENL